MIKLKTKKLQLARETLRALSVNEMAKANGGVPCSAMWSTCSSEFHENDGTSCSRMASQATFCVTEIDSECVCY